MISVQIDDLHSRKPPRTGQSRSWAKRAASLFEPNFSVAGPQHTEQRDSEEPRKNPDRHENTNAQTLTFHKDGHWRDE